jgi:FkbM family methyltransferase
MNGAAGSMTTKVRLNGRSVLLPENYARWLSDIYDKGKFYEEEMLLHIAGRVHGGTFIDVGANAGNHTVFFSLFCRPHRVHAFEPNAVSRGDLERIVSLNALDDLVTIHPIALSDKPGSVEATFVVRKDVPNWTQVAPCKRLDEVVHDDDIKVIKIDVEGAEPKVLRGAARILSSQRPVIYAEANTPGELAEILYIIIPFGYRPTGRVFNTSLTYEFEHADA